MTFQVESSVNSSVLKRGGSIQRYVPGKIRNAVKAAFSVVREITGKDEQIILEIEESITRKILDLDLISVEEIQDLVEEELMEAGLYQEARAYILKREERRKFREKRLNMPIEALSEYIFITKYARYLSEKHRRETYREAVDRSMNMHLKRFPQIEDKIRWAFKRSHDKKVLSSMRALENSTPIITKEGWKAAGEIKEGDILYDSCGRETTVKGVVSFQDKPLYRIVFSDESELLSCGEHLWIVSTLEDRTIGPKRVLETRFLEEHLKKDPGAKFVVWNPAPIERTPKDLIIDPYVLGLWLGNRYGDDSQYSPDLEDTSFVLGQIEKCGYEVIPSNSFPNIWNHYVKGLHELLRECNLIHNEHIPAPYLMGSVEQRLSLLQGLMDAGGCIEDCGRCHFNNSSRLIIGGVQELLAGLGIEYVFSVREGEECLDPRDSYILSFYTSLKVARLPGKARNLRTMDFPRIQYRLIKSVEPTGAGDATCFHVDSPDQSFLAGRRMIVTHNSLQFAGKAIKQQNNRIYNCSFSLCDRLSFFSEAFYLLLCGCGVGFSVQKRHVKKLPPLGRIDIDVVHHHIIEDNIEGWADALNELIHSYVEGFYVEFSYHKIRKRGTPLMTSGGRAPGHYFLKKSLEKIREILEGAQGRKLKPIECHDIVCVASEAVLSGGVRRSACISLFSLEDGEMMTAKTGQWFDTRPWRSNANNSVVLIEGEFEQEDFDRIFSATKEFGEPGFYFTHNPDVGINPCGEARLNPVLEVTPENVENVRRRVTSTTNSFAPLRGTGFPEAQVGDKVTGWQFCVSGNTKLLTREGITTIKDSVGQEIEIWNGVSWSKTKPFITGQGRQLYRVHLSDGSYLDCTENHKWLVRDDPQKEFSEVETVGLLNFSRNPVFTPQPNISYDSQTGKNENSAYTYGVFAGSGFFLREEGKIYPIISLLGDRRTLPVEGSRYPVEVTPHGRKTQWVNTFEYLDTELCIKIKTEWELPSEIFSWDRSSILSFIAGWADVEGGTQGKELRIHGLEGHMRSLQLLLTKIGFYSKVSALRAGEDRTPNIWYIQFPDIREYDSYFIPMEYQSIQRIELLPGKHFTYCLEEPERHQCLFNNVITKQCNLTETNAALFKTEEDVYEAMEAAAIIGTLQSAYTDFPYLGEVSEIITRREALIGVSMTGMVDSPELSFNPEVQRKAARIVVETNKKIANLIGVNPAARCTNIKPSGTTSLLLGCVGSGIGTHHSRRYFRRVQANPVDPVYLHFKNTNPHMCNQVKSDRDVITFCVQAPENSWIKEDLSAIDALKMVVLTQENYVKTGTAYDTYSPGCHHGVSNTIMVREEEWEPLKKFIWDNRRFLQGLTLLGEFSDKLYKHAPREAVVTEEDEIKWNYLIENYKPVDYSSLVEEEDNTERQGEISCAGGKCDLVL